MTPASLDLLVRPRDDRSTRSPRPWAERIVALAQRLATALDDRERSSDRGELWLLLTATLSRCARLEMQSIGPVSREDIEDLVASKALDLLHRIEAGSLVLRDDTPGALPGFLARTMRNAIVDLKRRERVRNGGFHDAGMVDIDQLTEAEARIPVVPSNRVEFDEVTRALESCLEKLAPRARLIWIFRTFFEMSSRDIAAHPDIQLKASHVDVLVGRTRSAVQTCLVQRGLDASHFDVVGIARLWDRFVRPSHAPGITDDA
jgi:RNA polymerase sigma factor (sigma-70 family)